MVGLSVILENYRDVSAKKSPQVINKGSMIRSCPSNLGSINSGFLHCCFLCNQILSPSKDIYMYKGDRAFCSLECRCRQILMDDEESSTMGKKGCTSSSREYYCSLAAIKAPHQHLTTSSPSSSRSAKGPRNRSNAFAC